MRNCTYTCCNRLFDLTINMLLRKFGFFDGKQAANSFRKSLRETNSEGQENTSVIESILRGIALTECVGDSKYTERNNLDRVSEFENQNSHVDRFRRSLSVSPSRCSILINLSYPYHHILPLIISFR